VSRSSDELEKMLWKSAEADSPPTDGAKRLIEALSSRFEALDSNASPTATQAVATASRFTASTLAVPIAAILLPLAAAFAIVRSDPGVPPSTPAEVSKVVESRANDHPASATPPPPTSESTASSVSVLSIDDLPSAAPTTTSTARRRVAPPPAPAPPTPQPSSFETSTGAAVMEPPSSARSSDLDAEVAMLDEIRERLRTGAAVRATALLREYDARFPRGLLQPEAKVLQIEAVAAAGDKARAHDLAVSFLARYPNAPQAARIRQLEAQLRQ
jgi:hypothetical protein